MTDQAEASKKFDQMRAKFNELFQSLGKPAQRDHGLLIEAMEQLQVSLEELWVAEEELHQQNEELALAREEVELERQRYQDLFEFALDGYLLTDRFGKIIEANRAAAQLVNMPQDFMQGKPLSLFITPEQRSEFRRRINKIQTALGLSQEQPDLGALEGVMQDRLYTEWEVSLQPRKRAPIRAALSVAVTCDGEKSFLRWSIHDITRRDHAQRALESSERKFKTLAEITSVAILLVQAGRISYANPAARLTTGYLPEELVGKDLKSLIHPDDRSLSLLEQGPDVQAAGMYSPKQARLKLLTKNGEECWVDLSFGSTELDDGDYWVITAYDITPAIRADRAQKDLLRWLVTVQEEERRRLSRELHDQMGQELTALTLGLKALEKDVEAGGPGLLRLKQLQRITYELGEELHRVAFELRPTSLDDLGLRSSLNNYIEEWSERSGIRVEFETTGLKDGAMPSAIATTVFRIVQEALNNVLRHSGASQVSLIFDHRPGEIRVIVEDNGCGFNVEKLQKSLGGVRRLGLLGMQERAELVGGAFVVESEAGKGTTVYVNIPLGKKDGSSPPDDEEDNENGHGNGAAANLPG